MRGVGVGQSSECSGSGAEMPSIACVEMMTVMRVGPAVFRLYSEVPGLH